MISLFGGWTRPRASCLAPWALAANLFVGGGGGSLGDGLFGFIINAAKTDAGSNLLQTPSLMTLDNEEATILVGQEVPITTGEALLDGNTNPFRTTQRQDIGVKLVVRPTPNSNFRRVDARVLDGDTPIVSLSTVVGRN